MRRFKLILTYEGTPFFGWQRQKGLPTVQAVVEEALTELCGRPITIWGSGRTDAGVHAQGQVAHVDLDCPYTPFAIQGALNSRLKEIPVSILGVEEVPPTFHARLSATSREYLYKILNRRGPPTFERKRVWWIAPPLAVDKMAKAATFLVGRHDFTSFRGTQCQAASPIKTLDLLTVTQDNETLLIRAKARSFLHHQVRNIVGTLKRVGDGSWAPEKVGEILKACDRRQAGATAPPEGLYLMKIDYGAPDTMV